MWKKRGKLNLTIIRRIVQLSFLLFILYGGYLGITNFNDEKTNLISENVDITKLANENLQDDPRLDIYLPIRSCKNIDKDTGVFKGCGMFMLTDALIYRSFLTFAIPIFFLILFSLIFGRTWCGWACPMGFFQEIFDWIRGLFRISYFKISRKTHRILKKIKWGWLATIFLTSFVIALPFFTNIRKDLHNINCLTCPTRYALMWFPKVDPTFFSFQTSFYSIGSIILFIFIGIFILSFFVRRFWCRLCPNGALLSLFNKGCFTTKTKDLQKCTKCGICYQVCPMDNEDVYTIKNRKVVNSKNCVMCFECLNKCPENDCINVNIFGKTILKSKYNKKK
jgi:ferredoxin-type protein NapH